VYLNETSQVAERNYSEILVAYVEVEVSALLYCSNMLCVLSSYRTRQESDLNILSKLWTNWPVQRVD
jgi:hypothetical protein